jgi:UV DNA damage repair endonuclease
MIRIGKKRLAARIKADSIDEFQEKTKKIVEQYPVNNKLDSNFEQTTKSLHDSLDCLLTVISVRYLRMSIEIKKILDTMVGGVPRCETPEDFKKYYSNLIKTVKEHITEEDFKVYSDTELLSDCIHNWVSSIFQIHDNDSPVLKDDV